MTLFYKDIFLSQSVYVYFSNIFVTYYFISLLSFAYFLHPCINFSLSTTIWVMVLSYLDFHTLATSKLQSHNDCTCVDHCVNFIICLPHALIVKVSCCVISGGIGTSSLHIKIHPNVFSSFILLKLQHKHMTYKISQYYKINTMRVMYLNAGGFEQKPSRLVEVHVRNDCFK